jgi:hypothetical protein
MADNSSGSNSSYSEKTVHWPIVAGAGVILLSVLIYLPGINRAIGAYWSLVIYDTCVIISAVTAAVLAARLWRIFEKGETMSLIWGNMALGFTLWAAGEFIWSSDQIWGGNSLPYPSMADILWILGYIPFILALGIRLRTLRIKPDKWWQRVVFFIYGLVLIMVFSYVIVPIYNDTSSATVFEKVINLVYPVGDLIVAFLATTLMMVLIGGVLFSSWGLIALGFLFVSVSDLLYAWSVWQGTYQVNPVQGFDILSFIINTLYVTSYVLVAAGVYKQARMLKAI